MKAPVSRCSSHGAVVSQARSRTMMSPTLTDWPGRKVRSREMTLRLLSTPMTAVRCAIGVVPGASSDTDCGMLTVSVSGWTALAGSFSRSGAPCGPQAASMAAAEAAAAGKTHRRATDQSGVQAS
jgi:hypothetical protein